MGHVRWKSRVSFAPMSGDLLFLTVLAGGLAVAYLVWHCSLEAREAANRVAREACSRAVVQFLDETVAFAGFRLHRSPHDGRRRLLRTYTFDYTSDGFERSQGFVVMSGRQVEAVGLAGAPS
jgi:Protein of unknown function (DUF3301)